MEKKFKMKGEGYETPRSKSRQEGDMEMGVSRSGRVRKKPSKLVDFESPDEIDIRTTARKKEKLDFSVATGSKPMKKPMKDDDLADELGSEPFTEDMHQVFIKDEIDQSMFKEEVMSEESENEIGYTHNEESSLDSMVSDLDEIEEPDLDKEGPEGFQPIAGDPEDSPSQNQSLYMLEKSNRKKLVIKDGKIVGRTKAQRKDKGKTRFTAYMLWAKEIRQEIMRSNPDLDFSQISKKLGELWSTVPYNEKYIWKRRAKRMASKGQLKTGSSAAQMVETGKKVKSPPGRKFINKSPSTPSSLQQLASSPPEPKIPKQPSISAADLGAQSAVFKPVTTTPMDVAAHLRLLGESLTIVGERLTEHEGHLTVSGSFSVLLDSLLCALVPLLCLTQQVPELNVIPQEQLSKTMDNIAYIMPGL